MTSAGHLAPAVAALRAGRLVEARELAERALKANRRDLGALELLGMIDFDAGRLDDALVRFRRLRQAAPKEPRYEHLLGRTLFDLGRVDEALAAYEHVAAAGSANPRLAVDRAAALERIGRTDEALAAIEPIATAPDAPPDAVNMLARVRLRRGETDAAVDGLQTALRRDDLRPHDRQRLLYTLVKALDRAGAYDDAFAVATRANAIDRVPFDAEAHRRRTDDLIAFFTTERVADLARNPVRDERPVFIAGLPRSGTTLVEQILDAHPHARGIGEVIHLSRMVRDLPMTIDSYEPYPACVADLTVEHCRSLGAAYLNPLRDRTRGAKRIVDKTLDNHEHLGLIQCILPAARAVVTRRDPRDVAVSSYLNPLVSARYPFTSDLTGLGVAHRAHERLIAHWRQVLELPILEIDYADLVADPEPHIRALVDFCGLPWDDRCLAFHASGRAVMTLSYDQVNRPVYRESMGRWRNYEKHLGPLLDALEAG